MFLTAGDIIAALRRSRDFYDPRTGSVLLLARVAPDPTVEPFRPGFIATIEERARVTRLMEEIDPRSRKLLVLWFMESRPVTAIARILGISRIHCYRLKDKALERMLDVCRREREAEEAAS